VFHECDPRRAEQLCDNYVDLPLFHGSGGKAEMAAKSRKTSIEVTLGELNNSVPALQAIVGMELPARPAFLLARATRIINEELEVYNETLASLREKHLIPRDKWADPQKPEWKTASAEKDFSKEAKALNDTVVTLPIEKFGISQLEGQKVQPVHLVNLMWLFDED
jgi:hypothetical protein